jgi:hypothetical protein
VRFLDPSATISQPIQMQLHLGEFGPVRVFGRTVIIVCSYRGGVESREKSGRTVRHIPYLGPYIGSFIDWCSLGPIRRHVASFRDHYANPRAPEAQLAMVKALLDGSKATEIQMVFDRRLPSGKWRETGSPAKSQAVDLVRWLPDLRGIDTVVLAYPDALGLTFGRLERRLVAAGAANIVILTGRRRLFPLAPRAIRSFRWRRLLASTRIGELMAGLAILPIAAALAGYDWFKSDSRSRS